MFPLRREAVVLGDHRPAVFQATGFGAALVKHRFDGKHHAFAQFQAGARPAEVQNLRFFVHLSADAVAAVFAHHAVAVGLRMALDSMADIAQARPGLDLAYTGPHRLEGHVHQAPGLGRHVADHVHLAGVGNEAAFFQGDVDVDDVAVLEQLLGAGHAVAHHFVDRSVDAEGVVVLPKAGRAGLEVIADEGFDGAVQLQGRAAGGDEAVEHVEDLRQQAPGFTHYDQLCGSLDHQLRPRIRSGLSSNSLLISSL